MQTESLQSSSHTEPKPCCGSCGSNAAERNRYYTGKYMTARDFRDEQEYFLSRHRLHTRLLHGWGIVCGLEVNHHPDWQHRFDTDCAKRAVVINPGIALDCCGREIVVPKKLYFELPLPRYPASAQTAINPDDREEIQEGKFLLGICYEETEIERVPALYAEGAHDPTRLQANRVREGARLVIRRRDQVQGDCWRTLDSPDLTNCRDDCDDNHPGPKGACLDPDCACGDMVPLALIDLRSGYTDYQTGFEIDDQGRRYVGTAPELLTHIVHINWPHGGEVTLSHLRQQMSGRLEIRFDRRLKQEIVATEGEVSTSNLHPEATGINMHTFVVMDRDEDESFDFTPAEEGKPPQLEDNGCVAAFTLDSKLLRPKGENIAGNIIYVTLKCDFVLDCHSNPVDGNFLAGRFPTGNGVKGGTFESWFRVVSDNNRQER